MRVLLFFALIGWHLLTTQYFGWNLLPQSEAELICDGMFIIGLILLFPPKVDIDLTFKGE